MDSPSIITWLIIVLIGFIGLIVFSKPIKYILRFLTQAAIGAALTLLFNAILSPIGVAVGINYLNLFILGLLGLPGFISLYFISWIA